MVFHELILFILFEHSISCYLTFEMLWQFPLIQMMSKMGLRVSVCLFLAYILGEPDLLAWHHHRTANARSTLLLRE